MKNTKKRILAVLLCFCLALSMVPTVAYADEIAEEAVETVAYTVNHAILDFEADVFVLKESEELTGVAGELTNAQAKEYESCILYDDIVQVEIAADGSTVVDVYYIELQEDAVAYGSTDLYDTTVSNDYFKVISADTYALAPGAEEHEIILNNADGSDRKVVHVFEVDTDNEELEVMPGYYAIDQLNPDDLAEDSDIWQAMQLTKTVEYYEDTLGYNVVGAMNTALAYDSNAPYGYMVWNGVVLGTPEIHSGAKTYLAINWDGTCELRSMSAALTGNEKTAISANFGWLVKDGVLTSTSVERTSSDASRSMIGIKADGTLIFCQVDGRNGAVSSGLSNYEMGEMMLALGCVNAVNCDGGGSSTFISKRAGESENTMRSIPSDGSERPTINSVILVSTAGATGVFERALIESDYDYIAPGASGSFKVTALDTKNFTMDMPAEVTYQVAEDGMGTISNGVFTAGSATGTATIQAVYNGEVVGEKVLNIVHPDSFGFSAESTVLPYGKSAELELVTAYGDDNWVVCVDGVYSLSLSNETAGTLSGNVLTATTDETVSGVTVTATYLPDTAVTASIEVTYGKGSEILFDFENGDHKLFLGVDEMYDWAAENGATAPIQNNSNYSEDADSFTFLANAENGQVKHGDNALGVTLDYTDAQFAGWSYNMFFYTGETVVLRDVANGQNATTFGMWVYIPEGAAGLAMQLCGYKNAGHSSMSGIHFYFTTTSGTKKNLNSCSESDIPESRWVYATADLTSFDYFSTFDPMGKVGREPSLIRFYIKPTQPANLTFYFDDFTLDYSSAVEDRVLPTISDITYATGDTAVTLNDGATLSGTEFTFTASVVDNIGLNTNTGVILVDGVAVSTTVSGSTMASDSVALNPGVHTVSFEIQDKLGNLAKVTRTITVSGDAVVTLSGHNDSGLPAEYDSVYYADINMADIATVDSLTATIYLQTANTWEPQGIEVADGFTAEYEINAIANELTVTVTRTGETPLTGTQTLVSLPIRIWSWNGSNHVTDIEIAPATQFATGYCPVVTVYAEVVYGTVTTTDGTTAPFGGNHSHTTNLNDNVNPWHYHDAEMTVLNQGATCTSDGYTGRTYCGTCKSVVDWGTKIIASGHVYRISGTRLVCDCGDVMSDSGIVKVDGKLYYLIADSLVSGWQTVGDIWCYADPTTMEVQTGVFTVDGLSYTAGEDGLLVSGVWVEDYLGRKYSYGPQFYTRCFQTIDNEVYYFAEKTGYALTGYQAITENRNDPNAKVRWYHFDTDGKLLETMSTTGILDTGDGLYYMEEGCVAFAGMVKVGDDYYCSSDKNGTILTGYQWVGSYIMANSDYPMEKGYYEFAENGKLLNGIVTKEDGTYYYEMGKPVAAGWVKDGDDYYVFDTNGKALTGRNWVGTYLNETSKDPYKVGTFIFDKSGKLANGIVEADDGWYYCVSGVGKEAYLVCVDGEYYYADKGGKLATGRIWVGTYPSHGLLPKGYYEFGSDGKMLSGVVTKDDGTYYYELGKPVDTGWLKVGEDYYVFTNGGKALTGQNWVGSYLTQTSRDPYMKGNFYFAADGKLANGVVTLDDGNYYYEMGIAKQAGLVCIDGNYYLAETNGKLATGRIWVGTYASNNLISKGYYTFGENGAMLQGVVEMDDGLYYYDLGNTKYLGLIKRNGEYYYVNEGGKLEIGRVWVGSYPSNGLLPKGYYTFGDNGAMLNGFEQLSDGLYYYNMGTAAYMGLVVIGDDLYYIEEGGKVVTGENIWVGTYASNGLIPAGRYTFDEEGRFVK